MLKRAILLALREGRVQHEPRSALDEKNLLAVGDLSKEAAHTIIEGTRGKDARSDRHHRDPTIEIWILKPGNWYIKCYMVEDLWFISFHAKEDIP